LRFTVHRPPGGEVSLRWYCPSGGDVACSVHVGVTRPRAASDAREDRLALAVFGCDVPADRASLRSVRGRDPFDSARGLVVKPGNEPAPRLTTDRAAEPPFFGDPNARLVNGAARGARHRPHVEFLHSNGLCEIPERLLLHRLRPGRQPTVFGADLSQLRRLLVVTRGATARLPKLLLLDGHVPHEPHMPAMLQQHHLLSGRRQQPEPRHTRNLATATDTDGNRAPTYVGIGFPPRHKCPGFPSKEFR
jgi:hypothetical protein